MKEKEKKKKGYTPNKDEVEGHLWVTKSTRL